MGAATDVVIANLALRHLGQKAITSLTDTTDTTAVKVNDVYASLRKKLLREHPWNFAVVNAILGHVVDADKTITGATAANPVVITSAAHGFANGNIVSIRDVVGMVELNGRKYTVANQTTNTVELTSVDGSAYTAYSSGGKVGKVTTVGEEFDYTNRYLLPSDFLQVIKVQGEPEDEIDYRLQSGGTNLELHIDDDEVNIQYIASVTDPTKFDDTFVDVFALLLAARLAFTISQSRTMAQGMEELYEQELAKAKGLNAIGRGRPRQVRQDDVIDARGVP